MSLLLALALCAQAKAPSAPPKADPAPTVASVIEKVQELDGRLKTLSADFKQVVRWDDSGTAQTVEGTLSFKKKRLLRVEHRLPEPQLIVSDGSWLWVHRKETNQVIQMRVDDWEKKEPLAQGLLDFGGYAGLLKKYDAKIASSSEGSVEVALEPKDGKKDFSLTLKLSTKDWLPQETLLRAGAVTVRSRFENVKLNPQLPAKSFAFAPPPGAELFQR